MRNKPAQEMRVRRARVRGAAEQAHVGPARCTAGLAQVAGTASCHQVVPSTASAQASRLHVVDRHLRTVRSAVLTGVRVAHQDLTPTQLDRRAWAPDVVPQADDAGPRHVTNWRSQWTIVMRQRLGLAFGEKHDRTSHATDV